MPMIGKKEFVPQPNASPLPDEVYYNAITNEIFTAYEAYLRRIDEINQTQWTCSVTGKNGLTYLQACDSENEARAIIHSIPEVLRKVLAVLMTHMKTYSTSVALALLYEYTNLRYFIGEEVQLLSPGRRRQDVTILKVFPPKDDPEAKGTIAYGLNPIAHEYIVELVNDDDEVSEIRVPASRLTRHKGRLTRDKIRLFLKLSLAIQTSRFDHLVLREGLEDELGISNLRWTDIFAGPEPNFAVDTIVLKALGKKEATENLGSDDEGEEFKKANPIILKKKSNILSASKKKVQQRIDKKKGKGKSSDKLKKKRREEKEKKIKQKMTPEDKEREKEMMREARKQFEENYKNYLEKRDDLLCDDLKPLPKAWDVNIKDFDICYLKQIFMVTEFVNTFADFITGFKDYFPDGITFQLMLDILNDTEIGGSYGTLIQIIFSTILNSLSEGRVEDAEDIKIDNNLEMDLDIITEDNVESVASCNFTNNWVTTYFNTHEQLSKLKLDQFTISELLRIYILKVRDVDRKTGKRAKMGDMEFKLVKSLAVKNFLELDIEERLELFNLLIQDFFTIPEVVEKIDEANQTIYKFKIEIRHLNASHTKWLREHPIRNRIRKKKGSDSNGTVVDDASAEEKEDYRKEKAERESKLAEQIGSMKSQIRRLSNFSREFCLGQDRLFRKYWVFQFIPGIFVEHVPPEQLEFPCLESPVPVKKPVMADYLETSAKRRSRKNTKNNENLENSIHNDINSVDRCTGDMTTCSIHGQGQTSSRPLWSMYANHQLDSVIQALNMRGNRESELRTALEYERSSIVSDNLAQFDPKIFNPDYVEPLPPQESKEEIESEPEQELDPVLFENETRKSARIIKNAALEKANQNNVVQKTPEVRKRKIQKLIAAKYQNMESVSSHLTAFYNELSDFAERIIQANFSTFDESNWQKWKDELNSCLECFGQPNNVVKSYISLLKKLAISLKSFCLLPPLVVTLESTTLHSPSDKENIEVEPAMENVISEKWLELLKWISQEDNQEAMLEMDSSYGLSSISQLFVNYCILDKSINWEVSAEKVASRCKACKRRIGNGTDRVICDRCNRGYHTSCLKVRLNEDFKNNWVCFDCLPRNGPAVVETEIHEDTIRIDEKCGHCNTALKASEREIHCHDCNKNFHLTCSGLNRAPRGIWNCKKCSSKQKKRKESSDVDIVVDHDVRRSGRKRRTLIYSDDDDDFDYLPR